LGKTDPYWEKIKFNFTTIPEARMQAEEATKKLVNDFLTKSHEQFLKDNGIDQETYERWTS